MDNADGRLTTLEAALEINAVKAALQHCNKLLKKRPNYDIVKVRIQLIHEFDNLLNVIRR